MNTEAISEAPLVASPSPNEIPLTRREAADFLKQNGFRTSYSTLTKMCSPAIDTGPKSCGKFGRDAMYLPSVLLAWAKARMSADGGSS